MQSPKIPNDLSYLVSKSDSENSFECVLSDSGDDSQLWETFILSEQSNPELTLDMEDYNCPKYLSDNRYSRHYIVRPPLHRYNLRLEVLKTRKLLGNQHVTALKLLYDSQNGRFAYLSLLPQSQTWNRWIQLDWNQTLKKTEKDPFSIPVDML